MTIQSPSDEFPTHRHEIPTHVHGEQSHNHGGVWEHSHENDHPDHSHDSSEHGVEPDHDHGPQTSCGHLGGDVPEDPGTVRTLIQHRGRTWLLCRECSSTFPWDDVNAQLDRDDAEAERQR